MAGSRRLRPSFSCPASGVRACLFLCLLTLFFQTPQRVLAFENRAPAEYFFRLLPVDIFENTGEPFREEDKDVLFAVGYTPAWVLAHNGPDTLIVTALDAVRTEVVLHLFRNVSGGVAVLSARTPDSCACEFWRWDAKGGLVPEAPPEDPGIADFFPAEQPLAADLRAEFFFCLTESYAELEAKPRFWNAEGPVDLTPTKRVLYSWGGAGFSKKIISER